MVEIVKNNLDEIIDACKKHQIKSLYLIGSAARGNDFTSKSDIDFLFEFEKDQKAGLFANNYFDLLFKLETITGKKVDLIAAERIRNKYFLQSINKDRIKIYDTA